VPRREDSGMSDWRHLYTERLELRAISANDTDVVYSLNSDPRVWTHFPSGVHTSREQTATRVTRQAAAWERDGLGYWTARTDDGCFAGVGGCAITDEVAWNVYYRFIPEAQGKGLASELVRAALSAARAVRPELPVVALLLERNRASKAVAERSGLDLVWRGLDTGNPDPAAVRLVYADRGLDRAVIGKLLAHM
jgi:RimJ/RimL family protein N-acetyltransferase